LLRADPPLGNALDIGVNIWVCRGDLSNRAFCDPGRSDHQAGLRLGRADRSELGRQLLFGPRPRRRHRNRGDRDNPHSAPVVATSSYHGAETVDHRILGSTTLDQALPGKGCEWNGSQAGAGSMTAAAIGLHSRRLCRA
jgi:hypothetical protein